jgi:hypothetical protein
VSDSGRVGVRMLQARGPVKLILVHIILHSTWDWSISYLRGTFGV